jgi:hypothetical protein
LSNRDLQPIIVDPHPGHHNIANGIDLGRGGKKSGENGKFHQTKICLQVRKNGKFFFIWITLNKSLWKTSLAIFEIIISPAFPLFAHFQ